MTKSNLARSNPGLAALADFANTRDDKQAVARFLRIHPGFVDEALKAGWPAMAQRKIVDPLNLASGAPLPDAPPPDRFAAIEQLPEDETFRLFRDLTRAAWSGSCKDLDLLLFTSFDESKGPAFSRADWQRGGLTYAPRNDFQAALYELLKSARFAKVCINPDCPARFFIAADPRARFCCKECATTFQRQAKLDWWNRVGKKKRAEKLKKKKPTRRGK
ncbi:MAG: hypothetical protein GZ088_00150 [Acidipila sp.]|nr:hypothetical protein [Acidipila sp.]